MNIQYISNKN